MKKFFVVLLLAPAAVLAQSLSGVESVEYDPINDRYLASSDNTSIVEIAPDGTLSHFGSGLDAYYGMEVMNNTLFAIVGTHVYGYDLTTEMEVMDITISGAGFLNGMASDPSTNRIWVTDFSNDRIYEIDATDLANPTSTMIVSQTTYTPNGVFHDAANNRLIYVTWGSGYIYEVDLTDYSMTNLEFTNVSNIDGIDRDGQGNYFIAYWSPAGVRKYNSDFSMSENISVPGINQPADICYAVETDTLAIPGNNQVIFVGFDNTTGIEAIEEETGFSIYPNPVTEESSISYLLEKEESIALRIMDTDGKRVADLANGTQSPGSYRVMLTGLDLAEGTYLCSLTKGATTTTSTFIYTK